MKRLTVNKEVSEMSMFELAHNGCHIKNGCAWFRDYEKDTDARELTRKLLKLYAEGDDAFTCDDDFDEYMLDCLQYGTETIEGLLALFYRNLWAMAELHESLKCYEDLEEQGLLLKLPCKVGSTVYQLRIDNTKYLTSNKRVWEIVETSFEIRDLENIGKTVFLAKAEAEEALRRKEAKNEIN